SGASPAAADISITNTTMPNPAIVGKSLTYGMNIVNNGPEDVTGVVVSDALPARVTLVSAVVWFPGGPRTPCSATGTVTCNSGTLGGGRLEGAGVFITVQPQNVGSLSNTATVTADNADQQSATADTDVEPQVPRPVTVDPNLAVSPVVTGLTEPTGLAFLGPD